MPNHYQILNINSTATLQQIKIAFRKQIKKHHPDKHSVTQTSQAKKQKSISLKDKKDFSMKIIQAYQCLTDSNRKKQYDLLLQQQKLALKVQQNRYKEKVVVGKNDGLITQQKEQQGTYSKSSSQQTERNLVFVCSQCLGQMQISANEVNFDYHEQVSINCQYCGMYMMLIE